MSQEKKKLKISSHSQSYAKATSISARLGQLQFHRSGKFRVIQVADLQEGPRVCADTIHLLEAMCDVARPDIVIFTGNQIAGYNRAFAPTYRSRRWSTLEDGVFSPLKENNIKKLALSPGLLTHSVKQEEYSNINYGQAVEYTRKLVIQQAEQFLNPLIKRGIPYAITYGNHDFQCGLSNAELDDIYRTFSNCVNPLRAEGSLLYRGGSYRLKNYASILPNQECNCFSTGTFTLPVLDVERENVIAALTLVDSGDYSLEGGYGGPSYEVLNWLRGASVDLMEDVKPLVFQHFPIEKMYSLLKVVPPETAYSVRGYPPYEKKSFILDPAKTQKGDYLGEAISMCARGREEFSIIKNHYLGLFAGHDHRNGFVGKVDGVLLGTAPTAGFGSYGPPPSRRAVRYIEFDVRHPEFPRTELLEFGDLVGQTKSRSVYTFSLLEKNSLAVGSNGFAERFSDSTYQSPESDAENALIPPRILSKTDRFKINSVKTISENGNSLESLHVSQENDKNIINQCALHQQEKEMLIRDLRATINEVKANF